MKKILAELEKVTVSLNKKHLLRLSLLESIDNIYGILEDENEMEKRNLKSLTNEFDIGKMSLSEVLKYKIERIKENDKKYSSYRKLIDVKLKKLKTLSKE